MAVIFCEIQKYEHPIKKMTLHRKTIYYRIEVAIFRISKLNILRIKRDKFGY